MLKETWQRNLAAVWVAQFLTMMGFSFVFPILPLYIQSLGVRDPNQAAQWAGAIVAASALSMVVAQPVWGSLADRWGRKPQVVRSMASAAVILTLMGFVTGPEQLLILRLIQGALSGISSASNALISSSTPKHHLGFALGLIQVSFFAGASVGPLVGGVMADSFGYRVPFYVAGALFLMGTGIIKGFVRENHVRPRAGAAAGGILTESWALMSVAMLPAVIFVMFMIQLGNVIINPVLSLFIAELNSGQSAASMAGIIIAATGAVSAIAAVTFGRLGDRIGHGVILPACLLGAGIAYFPQSIVQDVWQLLILRVLLGLFLGGPMPTANVLLASAVPPEKRGAAFGLSAMAFGVANGIGPLAGAGIATQWGFRAVFIATGALYFVAFGWAGLKVRRPQLARPRSEV